MASGWRAGIPQLGSGHRTWERWSLTPHLAQESASPQETRLFIKKQSHNLHSCGFGLSIRKLISLFDKTLTFPQGQLSQGSICPQTPASPVVSISGRKETGDCTLSPAGSLATMEHTSC